MVFVPSAALLVDIQNDFCEGGSLAVPGASGIIPTANMLIDRALNDGSPIIASRCWHPSETTHFQKWPSHCVAGTYGAEFNSGLSLPSGVTIISKGMEPDEDAYSAFDGYTWSGRMLFDVLGDAGIKLLYVAGLATDYCVKATVIDALRLGFDVAIFSSGVAAVDADSAERAINEMLWRGAAFVHWTMDED